MVVRNLNLNYAVEVKIITWVKIWGKYYEINNQLEWRRGGGEDQLMWWVGRN